ncbi:uncharacterized protein B0I36DRAFT_106377 [Microdochium trichocladiopsis]|uniref:Uncharacterized protein n=1 Tax=Microdochium trichocladiopsis TaxID=1682393 RepID=A0A9P8Y8Q0_9PEZI|nr:uncharacterized protein B0I36DRAFT_106377 [Microdochium trichocladiopsis]KAH7033229.1 hypothetical protein B0I36DRAFT_106377 [Microdochium trichocladiopsis]
MPATNASRGFPTSVILGQRIQRDVLQRRRSARHDCMLSDHHALTIYNRTNPVRALANGQINRLLHHPSFYRGLRSTACPSGGSFVFFFGPARRYLVSLHGAIICLTFPPSPASISSVEHGGFALYICLFHTSFRLPAPTCYGVVCSVSRESYWEHVDFKGAKLAMSQSDCIFPLLVFFSPS